MCSVVDFLQGNLGQPAGGFPEPLTSRVIKDKKKIEVCLCASPASDLLSEALDWQHTSTVCTVDCNGSPGSARP